MGISEELAGLERNMSWLATTASVSPSSASSAPCSVSSTPSRASVCKAVSSLRAVAPGISEALIATAAGLAAAIPAAIAYNQFTHRIRELGARMDDFSLEFLNMTERGEE